MARPRKQSQQDQGGPVTLPATRDELEKLKAELERSLSLRQLDLYRPHKKQAEFHQAGKTAKERLFMAGNQQGKSLALAAEVAMHLTGEYPDWWVGRRFPKPIKAWVGGVDGDLTRDGIQVRLVGLPESLGTGMVPKRCVLATTAARGTTGLFDTVLIQHTSGGKSTLGFKSYKEGRLAWQAASMDFVGFDEEPPEDIYSEGIARLTATGGCAAIAATPLLGMSDVVRKFYPRPTEAHRRLIQATIEDADHIPAEKRAEIMASFPAHERDARAKGVPMLGSGRVFPVPEDALRCEPFQIPKWWKQIGGLDFGWDHPTAAVHLVHDPDGDIVYVTKTYRQSEQTPLIHSAALKPWNPWMPWAWPHDGLQTDKGSGEQLAEMYRQHGLRLRSDHAKFEDGTWGVEAGLAMMLERMQTGRWKVFDGVCEDWFEEFRVYHRKDGRVVKAHDDLMSASRYAAMELRHARSAPVGDGARFGHTTWVGPGGVPYDPFRHGEGWLEP